MVVGGMQKNSMIDYPGKISCVIFLSGCNFDCPYCHNPDLVQGCTECPANLTEANIWQFLESHRNFLDGVVISGGEPTLQPDLADLCKKIKQIGYPIKLDTNGSRPEVLEQLLENGLIDYVAMDVKTDPGHYAPIIQKKSRPDHIVSSIRLIMESGLPYEFKTTCIKPLVDTGMIESIARLIKGARLWALQECRETQVLHPEFFQSHDCRLGEDELLQFQTIGANYVEKCIVR